jgi:hypothetical protein
VVYSRYFIKEVDEFGYDVVDSEASEVFECMGCLFEDIILFWTICERITSKGQLFPSQHPTVACALPLKVSA